MAFRTHENWNLSDAVFLKPCQGLKAPFQARFFLMPTPDWQNKYLKLREGDLWPSIH